jgi:hypothetical protein
MTQANEAPTPGPWRWWAPEREGGKWQIDADGGAGQPVRLIATVHRGMPSGSRAEANAHLIAAAPDMLAALRAVEEAGACYCNRHLPPYGCEGSCDYAAAMVKVRAALRKAEGRA